jgi:hypothetical protein
MRSTTPASVCSPRTNTSVARSWLSSAGIATAGASYVDAALVVHQAAREHEDPALGHGPAVRVHDACSPW